MKSLRPRSLSPLLALAAALVLGWTPRLAADPPEEPDAALLEENWMASIAANGRSHASGDRPELGAWMVGTPTQAVVALRVGLYYSFTATGAFSEFASLHHPFVRVSSTVGEVQVRDRSNGHLIAVMEPGVVFEVRRDGDGFAVAGGGQPLGTFVGPVRFEPATPDEQLRVDSILRANILGTGTVVPRYRGALEVARGTITPADRVNLVNVIEVESYVPGVVANESLASFRIEALKAQATAARGYAVSNIGRFARSGYPFDIVDSSSSQVYRGILSEHVKAVQAASETRGLVAVYQGRIIQALYSSSFGGASESNEWIFPTPSTSLPGANPEPYLRGIYDGAGTAPDFSDPAALAAFWGVQQPLTYDSCAQVNNRFSRWRIAIPAATIKARLPGRYVVVSGSPTTVLSGAITDVQETARMTGSGRIAIARVTLTSGVVDVRGWDNLRNVLGRSVVSTPLNCGTNVAANFTLNNPSLLERQWNPDGTLNQVIASGGGWGHNVGFSQYGSQGRAIAGQGFREILHAYYTGIDVSSYPIDIGREPGSGPPTLRQEFLSPDGNGALEVRARDGLKKLVVHVNAIHDIVLEEEELAAPVVRVDLTPWLEPGLNVVQYNPVGNRGEATVNVIVDP
jgi:peptidoglycan hydrolase-like amidase